MAVELKRLYDDIYNKSDVKLLTKSCFHKHIAWVHMVENREFISLLHGDELIFNSSLNYETEAYRKEFIDELISQDAGGLILALQEHVEFSDSLIAYCNEKEFPLFKTSWETSFLNIMRRFSVILLTNERNETNLLEALKNAIYYPSNEALYVKHFERNDFLLEMPYVITVIEITDVSDTSALISHLHHRYEQCIVYEENNRIILLTVGLSIANLRQDFENICAKFSFIRVGIGSLESSLSNLHISFQHAADTCQLSKSVICKNPLCYDDIGIYQLLCSLKVSEEIGRTFIYQTLGKLIAYDLEHKTNYLQVLKDFFENECSIVQTANATFFHQNTLKYKIKHIREILGYDITSNENRTKIMLSLYMLTLSDFEFDV